MTSYQDIYDAFLSKIKEDEWANGTMTMAEIAADWESLLESAIVWFKFPRFSLEREGSTHGPDGEVISWGHFNSDLNSQEVQILAVLMKWQWLDRTIHAWDNVKAMYDERDFSQANLLHNFVKLLESTEKEAKRLQKLYSRSIEDEEGHRSAWHFGILSGKNNGIID